MIVNPKPNDGNSIDGLDISLASKGLIYIGDPAVSSENMDFLGKDYLNYCTKLILDAGFSQSSDQMFVMINNCGGDVFDFIGIYEAILFVRTYANRTVNTIVNGLAASAANIILQAGERRIMTPNSFLMLHDMSSGTEGTVTQMETDVRNANKIQAAINGIICNRSGITDKKLRQMLEHKDLYLDSHEALKLNLVDEVTVTPKIPARKYVKKQIKSTKKIKK